MLGEQRTTSTGFFSRKYFSKLNLCIFVFLATHNVLLLGLNFASGILIHDGQFIIKFDSFFRRKLSWRKQLNLPRFNYGKYQILLWRPRMLARRSTLNSYFWFLLYQDQYFPTLSAQNFKEITKFCLFFVACAAGSCFVNRNQFNFPEN